jgi:hypothetical protein
MNSEEQNTVVDQREEIKTIDFFGIRISLNAYIILIVGFIVCIILIFMPPYGPFAAAILLLFVVIAAYNVNCLLVGHCKIWAWVVTIVYIIFSIVNIMTVYARNKKGLDVKESVFSKMKTATKRSKSSSK